nr:immunoglobulin heavy chain junction region [Mus musculus]NSM05733.1 immunoglobulin heavy chain junction region [Mus musculus]NSM05968.1 immunoglobulin heavy chain junction region [Mus musculus]NSM05999.1 immunoglobulin heavy chain junction region [Mus musculus]NSM06714.1 immunoglobulin heavy chain junction region [Mus musculus]
CARSDYYGSSYVGYAMDYW